MRIRRVQAGEWREFREIRLRALRDAPDAFGATYAEEAAEPGARRPLREGSSITCIQMALTL